MRDRWDSGTTWQEALHEHQIDYFRPAFLSCDSSLLISQWTELQRMVGQPVMVQLSQLKDKYEQGLACWVILDGGTWDCKSIYLHDAGRASRTKILYGSEGSSAVYAEYSGLRTCEEIKRQYAVGTLSLMNSASVESPIRENQSL